MEKSERNQRKPLDKQTIINSLNDLRKMHKNARRLEKRHAVGTEAWADVTELLDKIERMQRKLRSDTL